jgi:uncharacterized protein YjbI with pentapeptide repeats
MYRRLAPVYPVALGGPKLIEWWTGRAPAHPLNEANLSDTYLGGANLSDADLSDADLYGVYLYGANLQRAGLRRANLSKAELSNASLIRNSLNGANLSDANLIGAYLIGVSLSGANSAARRSRRPSRHHQPWAWLPTSCASGCSQLKKVTRTAASTAVRNSKATTTSIQNSARDTNFARHRQVQDRE